MLEDRSARKQFLQAPPSVASAVAALLEPGLALLVLVLCHIAYGEDFVGASSALAMMLLALSFPGINRFRKSAGAVAIDVLLSWAGVLFVLLLVGYASRALRQFNPDMLLAWVVVTPFVQWLAVIGGQALLRHYHAAPDARRPAVIVGAHRIGVRAAAMLESRKADGRDFLGFFDDRAVDRIDAEARSRLLGTLQDLPGFIEAAGVKDVFITLPLTSQPRILSLMEQLQNTTASLHFVPDVFGVSIIQGRLSDMGGIPVVGLLATPFEGANGMVKRGSDIVLSLLILALASPLLLLLAIVVKLSSSGPVIFKQHRTGLNGEVIEVYKFRSMTVTENGSEVPQATRGDARITPFGAFMRRTSLDELPQFVNVLQGNMSIVGPRPHAVAHNDQYRKLIKAYMARHKVKPGITGWAQVNGLRGETDTVEKMARRVEYDLEYLRNWSLGLDLLIIARTAKLMFTDPKAF
jgi:putative colanic acid biosynthesis UDP-glucose lipid carrier transferase